MTHTRYNQRDNISFMSGVAYYFNFFMCQSVLTTKPRRDGTAKYVLEFLRNYRRVEISYQTFYLPDLFLLLTTCSLTKYASLIKVWLSLITFLFRCVIVKRYSMGESLPAPQVVRFHFTIH